MCYGEPCVYCLFTYYCVPTGELERKIDLLTEQVARLTASSEYCALHDSAAVPCNCGQATSKV